MTRALDRPDESPEHTDRLNGKRERDDGFAGDVDDADESDEDEDDEELYDEPTPDEQVAPAVGGFCTLLVAAGIALAVGAVLRAFTTPMTAWIADPNNGGDGAFAVSSAPPGATPPWRQATQAEIEQGVSSGALRRV